MNSARVCAVIVTYNRAELLRRCLCAILSQTIPVESIVVVNNASSDGTADMLAADFPQIIHLPMKDNLGGAGGFQVGMREAMNRSPDWLWMMDDDGFPEPKTLETLVRVSIVNSFDISGPLVLQPEEDDKLSFTLAGSQSRAEILKRFGAVVPRDLNPFNGTLVSRAAVKDLGLVKGEMFIWGDEIEYMARAESRGKKLGTVTDAIYRHPKMKSKHATPFLGLLGNIIVAERERANVMLRNMAYNSRTYRGPIHLAGKFSVHLIFYFATLRWVQIPSFVRYFVDGATDSYRLMPSREKFNRVADKSRLD